MEPEEKVRENRLRRKLDRMGYRLMKSRRRDPQAIDFGGYMIVNPWNNIVACGAVPYNFCMSLDDVEEFIELTEPNRPG